MCESEGLGLLGNAGWRPSHVCGNSLMLVACRAMAVEGNAHGAKGFKVRTESYMPSSRSPTSLAFLCDPTDCIAASGASVYASLVPGAARSESSCRVHCSALV